MHHPMESPMEIRDTSGRRGISPMPKGSGGIAGSSGHRMSSMCPDVSERPAGNLPQEEGSCSTTRPRAGASRRVRVLPCLLSSPTHPHCMSSQAGQGQFTGGTWGKVGGWRLGGGRSCAHGWWKVNCPRRRLNTQGNRK